MNSILEQPSSAKESPVELFKELNPFAEQVGTPKGLAILTTAQFDLNVRSIDGLPALRDFLKTYYSRVMVPLEFASIIDAYQHTRRCEVRELIESDEALGCIPVLKPFALVSQTVGRAQLEALRPLRDERVVQRYLKAVSSGRAQGWHTIVYGLILAIYSLPLRQGLIHYGIQTLEGFVFSAATSLKLKNCERTMLHQDLCANLPKSVESVLLSECFRV